MDLLEAFDFFSENPEAKYAQQNNNIPLGNSTYTGAVESSSFDWGSLLGKAIDAGTKIYQTKKLSDYGYPIGLSSVQASASQTPIRIDVPNTGTRQTGLTLPNSAGSFVSGINPTYLLAVLFILLIFIMKRSG